MLHKLKSTEPDAGILKHDNEELMDTSSPQQDINDVGNVIFSSPDKDTLLVDLKVSRQRNGCFKILEYSHRNTICISSILGSFLHWMV